MKAIQDIVNKLKMDKYQDSMKLTYYRVWKSFNQFFIKLDSKPRNWEDRITLFAAYLINEGRQSSTVKSYVSAIKAVLLDNHIQVEEDVYLLNSLTKACKLHYDVVNVRMPISKNILNIILKAVEFHFSETSQMYLMKLYIALFATSCYGLF